MNPSFISAAVLAGGQSRRMGQDKALLQFQGKPLVLKQIETIQAWGAIDILLSHRPDSACASLEMRGVRSVPDGYSDIGPIAGIVSVLEQAQHDRVLILAVDLPCMDAGYLTQLASQCAPNRGILARRVSRFEPLASIWPRAALPLVRTHIQQGNHRLQGLAEACIAAGLATAWDVPEPHHAALNNWNEPSDLPQ